MEQQAIPPARKRHVRRPHDNGNKYFFEYEFLFDARGHRNPSRFDGRFMAPLARAVQTHRWVCKSRSSGNCRFPR